MKMHEKICTFLYHFGVVLLVYLTGITLVFLSYQYWQQNSRLSIDADHGCKIVFTPRTKTRPSISALTVDLKALGKNPGSLMFRLRRVSLGTTNGAYNWDWKGAPLQSDFSFVDMTKMIRQEAKVTSWDVVVAKPGMVRLKIWQDLGDRWSVVAQTDKVMAMSGLNHFILKDPLPVRPGDFLGLYTAVGTIKLVSLSRLGVSEDLANQDLSNIDHARERGLQVNFSGDEDFGLKSSSVAAPNPGYAFKVNLSSIPIQESKCQVQLGRSFYKFEIADQTFAVDEQVELFIEARERTRVLIYPHFLWRLSGPHAYVGLEFNTPFKPKGVDQVLYSQKKSIFNVLIILLAIVSGLFMFVPRRRMREPALAAFPIVVAVMIGKGSIIAHPILQSTPAVLAFLFLPGYVVLELAFPFLAQKMGKIERPPLLFGLSLAVWTVIAIPSYWAQWSAAWVIAGMLLACLIGVIIMICLRPVCSSSSVVSDSSLPAFPFRRVYVAILVAVLIIVAVAVGFRSQFMRADFDTITHLAGFQRIVHLDRIMGGNPFLEPGKTALFHYASNPWYLVCGLTARLAHIEAFWLYSILAALLTVLAFMAFLCLLYILINDMRVAFIGTFLAVLFSLYGWATDWAGCYSFYLEFISYPHTLDQLIMWPLVLFCVLRYVRFKDMNSLGLTALIALATMGQHVLFIVWVVGITSLILVVTMFFRDFKKDRLRTLMLIVIILASAAVVAFFMLKFPLAGHMKKKAAEEIAGWAKLKGMSFYFKTLYAADIHYLGKEGWKQVLGFAVIIFYTCVLSCQKLKLCVPHKADQHFLIVVGVALFGPYLVIFNPFIVPWICQLFHWPQVIYRWPNLVALPNAVAYGAMACVLVLCFQAKSKWSKAFYIFPLIVCFTLGAYPFFNPSLRKTLASALDNRGWYPSMFDLAHDPLYQSLGHLKPGVVAIERPKTGYVVALTHHYLVAGHYNTNSVVFSLEDEQSLAKRWSDNQKILDFEMTAQQMRQLLDEYHCKYVVVSRSSPRLNQFMASADLFDLILKTETDFLFSVKRT